MAFSQELAKLYSIQGTVEVMPHHGGDWQQARLGMPLYPFDTLRTGENGRAGMRLLDGTLIRLNEITILRFEVHPLTGKLSIRIESGGAYIFSRLYQEFPEIHTSALTGSPKGTEFSIEVDEDRTILTVIHGHVVCHNAYGSIEVKTGERAVGFKDRAPVKRILLEPLDTVQWALYYPAAWISLDVEEFLKRASPQERKIWERLEKAALYLSAGQVKKTNRMLRRIEKEIATIPDDVRAKASATINSLSAIIALVNNRKDEALAFAQQAIESHPNSASASLAMSYVQQSFFKLEEALHWSLEAARLAPENSFAKARLSELYLGFGEVEKATAAAQEAIRISPDDAHAQTILGFVFLTRYQTKEAIQSFEKAIALDSSNGLPHLGLGLALIRKNKLEPGRVEIEKAVHLEPRASLFRSYLGKAYFEEKRDPLASDEYQKAKHLDPLDPTPYLYDAFHKLANTRPIEALWDIEESIKRNDNRAVYRSRMLLDQDQAVRSAGLSQAFTSIGFSEAARIEAIKSLNQDYANYAAHLLLADSNFQKPRLEQVTISEFLITRLLAPIGLNQLDPSIRTEASFNEYASLFDRQRGRFFFDGEAHSRDDFIQSRIFQSALFDQASYELSYAPYYIGGYRDNDWERGHVVGLIVHERISHRDTLLLETQLAKIIADGSGIGFDPRAENLFSNSTEDILLHRVGFHHLFNPQAHLIGQLVYADRESTFKDRFSRIFGFSEISGGTLLSSTEDSAVMDEFVIRRFKGLRGDVQYIWDSEWLSWILGGGVLEGESHKDEFGFALSDELGRLTDFTLSSSADHTERSQEVFTYSTLHLTEFLDLVLGGKYSRLELATGNRFPPLTEDTSIVDRFSPKAGLVVYATPSTTLRSTYFKTIGGPSLDSFELIEPTTVAGFNQVFDILFPGTRSENFGVGIDQKFSKRTYFGVELMRRREEGELGFPSELVDLDVDTGLLTNFTGDIFIHEQVVEEDLLNAYFYQVLHKTVTGTVDYTVAEVEDHFSETENLTHRLRLGLNYFHPSGWFAKSSATWHQQSFETEVEGVKPFWIVDVSLGYQLPKHYGVIILSIENLLDQDYLYESIGLGHPFLPDRSFSLRLSLNF